MKLILNNVNYVPSESTSAMIHRELEALQPDLQIDEARVRLERSHEDSPPFRVSFHLVTPGPDVLVEASDHTVQAALIKAFDLMKDKIDHRHQKRAQRKENTHITAPAPRRSGIGSRI